jgi:uncharacterized protein with FMN-binding domain
MKYVLRSLIALTLVFTLGGFDGLTAQKYKAGTYTGVAQGRQDKNHSGLIKVEVTVSETAIKDIKVSAYEQSKEHKVYGPPVIQALNEIPAAILEKQSLQVDGITKATFASNALELAVARALEQAVVKKYTPGTYKGSAYGRKDKEHSGLIEVEVTVSETAITDINVITFEQSKEHKVYGEPVAQAYKQMPDSILQKQSLQVDAVTKATMASDAISLAVARALEKAYSK